MARKKATEAGSAAEKPEGTEATASTENKTESKPAKREKKAPVPEDRASQAALAFERITPQLDALQPSDVASPNIDLRYAGLAALETAARLESPEFAPRIKALGKSGELDTAKLSMLRDVALAALHVRRRVTLTAGTATDVKIAPELAERSAEVHKRMAALCAYQLGDHPQAARAVAFLTGGTGYLDRADDLEGYADLYAQFPDIVSDDKKNFRSTDEADARKLAQELYEALGVQRTAGEIDWTDRQARVWTLLVRSYDEAERVGVFLTWYQGGREQFPSLHAAARSRAGTRSHEAKSPANEPVKP